jgi:hypothetical protein
LLLRYGSLRVLIPNGVDYAEINASLPEALTNLTVLILSPEDVSYIPPRVWRNLNAQAILWRDRGVSPFENSVGIDAFSEIHLISDGNETWFKN